MIGAGAGLIFPASGFIFSVRQVLEFRIDDRSGTGGVFIRPTPDNPDMRVCGPRGTPEQHADQHHAQRRYEKQKPGRIGHETGQEEEGRRQQKTNPVNDFSQRGLFTLQLLLGPLQNGGALASEQ